MSSENIYIQILKSICVNEELLYLYIDLCTKYSNFKNKKEAQENLNKKVEIHHILPKCFKLGGEKDKFNYTYLPLNEHRYAHKLLKDMFSGIKRKQMAFAYSRLIHRQGSKEELSTEEYISLKKEISSLIGELNSKRKITEEYRSNMSAAKSNTFWVNNGISEIMLKGNEKIPYGYTKGRISNKNKNRIWINDGKVNKMVYKDSIVLEGWSYGILRKNKKGS